MTTPLLAATSPARASITAEEARALLSAPCPQCRVGVMRSAQPVIVCGDWRALEVADEHARCATCGSEAVMRCTIITSISEYPDPASVLARAYADEADTDEERAS